MATKRTRKKKGSRGAQKGGQFERDVCKKLSRMVLPGSDETVFWRSASSGGRATIRHRQMKKGDSSMAGDICAIHPAGNWLADRFLIECKFYKSLDIQGGLLAGTGRFAAFWKRTCRDAIRHKKHPMMIARENRTRTLLLMEWKGHLLLHEKYKVGSLPLLDSFKLKAAVFDFERCIGYGTRR